MKSKKIVLFVFLIVGVLSLILTYKFKQNLRNNKPIKEEKLSIMIKEQGATDYTKSSSKDIPKGDYVLNEEKSYCKNNGKIEGYDSTTGTVSFAFIGTDRCFLYFDFKQETITIGTNEIVVNGGIPDFTKEATTNEGLYKTEDDLGMSYYFRGAVDNNWVKFGEVDGKPIYWRIIRINGDGSIRLIYTGTTAPTESQKVVMTGEGTQISTSAFNEECDKAEYVGYKYEIGKQHGLANDSTIKTALENWYKSTTLYTDTATSKLVVDTPFCYDRTASTSKTGTYGEISSWTSTNTTYYYGSYGRTYGNNNCWNPSLKRQNELDKYSVANGSLSYPVGLITADEIVLAGAYYYENNSYYLYTGQYYWSGSPAMSSGAASAVFRVDSLGRLNGPSVDIMHGVRPVVSLSSEAKLTGDGTWNNVYEVEKMGYETILANNGGKDAIEAKGTPTFATAATTNEGMYATEDDYTETTGMKSYYFRGAVNNNWVKFGEVSGKPIYWRIIRINGDGSIRMIYSGTTDPKTDSSVTGSNGVYMAGAGTQINSTTYKFNSNYNTSEYVGYMFTTGDQHGNSTSSDIKTTLENWYAGTSLKDNSLVSQDQIFCNDRSVTSGTWSSTSTSNLFYAPYTRLSASTPNPQLKCPTESDKFTSKKSSTGIGNKRLEYPVGLITADEVAMAGGKLGTDNSTYYLYTNQYYWLGSPNFFFGRFSNAIEFYVSASGNFDGDSVNLTYGARPVISLSSKAKLSGNGTYSNPYTVNSN